MIPPDIVFFQIFRYVHLDPLWADFQGTPATGSRPIPFVDALPASLWLYKQEENQPQPTTPHSNLKHPPPLPKRNKVPTGLPKKIGKLLYRNVKNWLNLIMEK